MAIGLEEIFRKSQAALVWQWGQVAIVAGFAALCFWGFWRNRRDIAERTGRAGIAIMMASAAILLVSLAGHQILSPLRPGVAGSEPKRVVLLIVDGLPTQYLRAYNPDAPASDLDAIIEDSLLFEQMRSSIPMTSDYHGILYTGQLNRPKGADTVLAKLQRAGVAVQWISYHRNGFPEGSRAQTSAYHGLRSFFLTHKTAWIPKHLGLDHHLVIASESTTRNLSGWPAKSLFTWINQDPQAVDDPLGEILLPELEAQAARAERSLTIFHLGYYRFPLDGEALARAQVLADIKHEDPVLQEIRDADYRYTPEHEPFALMMRDKTADHVSSFAQRFKAFHASLQDDEQLEDTVLIITSDHGSVFREGRFWYGYHGVEEVIRVPLFVTNFGKSGTDDRMLMTTDLSESLLDLFGLESGLDNDALSIFGDHDRSQTVSLTRRSDVEKEWFLLIYENDQKIEVNLHRDSDGKIRILQLDGYTETAIDELTEPSAPLLRNIDHWLEQFAVRRLSVHPRYR